MNSMNTANNFFPPPFSDETLYSWCARYHRLSGNAATTTTRKQLSCPRDFFGIKDIPCGLKAMVDNTILADVTDATTIAFNHSILGYLQPYLNTTIFNRCLQRIESTSLKSSLGLSLGYRYQIHGKYCRDCIEEDKLRAGYCYWHLSHQLPGVLLCHIHGTFLKMIEQQWHLSHISNLILPDDASIEPHTIQTNNQTSVELLSHIANISHDLHLLPTLLTIPDCFKQSDQCAHSINIGLKYLAALPKIGEFIYFRLNEGSFFPARLRAVLQGDPHYHPPLDFIFLHAISRILINL